MKPILAHLPKGQQGVTLIVALIFMAILALLGVTVAQTTQLEERMAGNTRDRDLAFQAAEAALTWASRQTTPNIDALSVAAINAANNDDAAYWNANPPGAIQLTPANIMVNGLAAYPQIWVEQRDGVAPPQYRVTARGVGATNNTVVILQAEYTFP